MLCSPIAPVAATNVTGATVAGKTLQPLLTNGGLGANRTPLSANKSSPMNNPTSASNINATSTTTTTTSNSNNNSMRQQNYEMMLQSSESNTKGGNNTLIREIKSRNIGSLSPLCQSIAANLNQQQQQFSSNLPTTPPAYISERRQAISMERLNNIHHQATSSPTSRYLSQIHSQQQQHHHQHNARVTGAGQFIISNKDSSGHPNNSGSLSSGSNSSIDESASDAERQDPFHLERSHELQAQANKVMARAANGPDRSSALARSASRVSRFRSAKEFFERLSSVNGNALPNQQPHIQNQRQEQLAAAVRLIRHSPERPLQVRALSVASRYANPLAASVTQVAPIGATPGSPLKRNAASLINYSSSPAINLLPVKASEISSQERAVAAQVSGAALRHSASSLADGPQPVAEGRARDEGEPAASDGPVGSGNSTTTGAVPRPRSLSLQLATAAASTPPPTPAKQIQLPKANSLAGAYVKLKTTDHSGLSTNTILHINNSQPANKSVIHNACQSETSPLSFCGDNVIVGTGSLLVRRNKQLRIHFDEQSTATFEYPSEEAFSNQFEADTRPDSPAPTLEPNGCDSNEHSGEEDDGAREHQQDEHLIRHREAEHESAAERWPTELERQSWRAEREHHASKSSPANLAIPKRPNLASTSLTNYRPSGLMSSDTSANIDDNLGIRQLVKPSHQQAGKQEEGNAPKRGLNHWSSNNGSVIYAPAELVKSHLSNRQIKLGGESQELNIMTSGHQNGNLNSMEPVAPNNPNYQTLRPTKHNKMRNRLTASEDSDTTRRDNGARSSPANWSNETESASDLLF